MLTFNARLKHLVVGLAVVGLTSCNSDSKRVVNKTKASAPATTNEAPIPLPQDPPVEGPVEGPITDPGTDDVIVDPGTGGNGGYIVGPGGEEYTRDQLEGERSGYIVSRSEFYDHRQVVDAALQNLLNDPRSIILEDDPDGAVEIEEREALRRVAINWQIQRLTMDLEILEVERKIAEVDSFLSDDIYSAEEWDTLIAETKLKLEALETLSAFINDEDKRETGEKTLVALNDELDALKSSDHVTQDDIATLESEIAQLKLDIAALEELLASEETTLLSQLEELTAKSSLTSAEQDVYNKLLEWKVQNDKQPSDEQALATAELDLSNKGSEKDAYDAETAVVEGNISYRENAIVETNALIAQKEAEQNELFSKPSRTAEEDARIATLDQEILSLENLIDFHQSEIAEKTTELSERQANRPDFESQIALLEATVEVAKATLATTVEAKNTLASEIDTLNDTLSQSYASELETAKTSLENKEADLETAKADYQTYLADVEMLEIMIDAYTDMFGEN